MMNEKLISVMKIIRFLRLHKGHGNKDKDISITMKKICDKSLLKPLIILFQNYFKWS